MPGIFSVAGWLVFFAIFTALFALSGCAGDGSVPEEPPVEVAEAPVRIVYVAWVSEIASAHVMQAVIEDRLGRRCELLPVTAISMWEAVAAGDQDGMVAAWLPSLHAHYLQMVEAEVEVLGPNLEGVEMGLVVPSYVPVDAIPELKDHVGSFAGKIIGIDPEAGLMENTARAIEAYGLDEYELISGSDATMTTALDIAIEEERWIVVTGWTPHWKFARWDLKYLEDPQKIYGEAEYIGTVVRRGLREDMPDVYALMDNFFWTAADMEQVMLWFSEEGMSVQEAARRWVSENSALVDSWVEP